MERIRKNDDTYLSKYLDGTCIDEAFYTEDEIEDLNGKKLLHHQNLVEWLDEESYFLDYLNGKPLLDYYIKTDFISPKSRKNEVISF